MNELNFDCSLTGKKNCVVKYRFGWFSKGIASGCLREGCTLRRHKSIFNYPFYSVYTHYLVRDFSRLSIYEPIWCPFDKSEIEYHLEEINRVLHYKIKWKLKEKTIYGINTWILKVKIPNVYDNIQHLYILTRIRQLYELPFCLYLKDAIKLQKELKFKGGLAESYFRVVNCAPSPKDIYFLGSYSLCPFNTVRSELSTNNVLFPGLDYIKEHFELIKVHGSVHLASDSNLRIKNPFSFSDRIKTPDNELVDLDWWINGYDLYRRPYYLGEKQNIPKYKRLNKSLRNYDLYYKSVAEWKKEIFNV